VMLYLFQKKILYDAPSESNRQPPPMQRKSPNKPELYWALISPNFGVRTPSHEKDVLLNY
jgi:hypothetical protein